MRRHQPNKAGAAALVLEESGGEQDRYQTASRKILSELVEIRSSQLIVITGDAGHGKTSMCVDLLEQLGVSESETIRVLKNLEAQENPVLSENESGVQLKTETGRNLRLVMDLSYVTHDKAARILEDLWSINDGGVSIVCANEGHLRAAISTILDRSSHPWSTVLRLLEDSDRTGRISDQDDSVFVLNLNYQSVVRNVEAGDGFINWVLSSWLNDDQEWQVCDDCEANNICPILESRKQLTEVEDSASRRRAVGELFRVAEQTGKVITFRQALMHLSHSLCGGLDCEEVEKEWNKDPTSRSWQYPHLYHQAIFGYLLDVSERSKISALAAFQLLDPGYVSIRAVDDDIDVLDGQEFKPPNPMTLTQSVRSRAEELDYAESVRKIFTYLRRIAFFDAPLDEGASPDRSRLGLDYGNEFQRLLAGDGLNERLRMKFIGGLEAVQGIQSPGDVHPLRVLDPAFHSQQMKISAAVVAQQVSPSHLALQVHPESWELEPGKRQLSDSVEWSARRLELQLRTREPGPISLPIGIIEFELLCRWSAGLSSRTQHEEVVRNFLLRLGELSDQRVETEQEIHEEVDVLVDGKILTLDYAYNNLRSWTR